MSKFLLYGSVALDTIYTPYGKGEEILGGSATYAALAGRMFSTPVLVGCVGEDFPPSYLEFLKESGISLEGLEIKKGKTFRWVARYGENPNQVEVLSTCQNVIEDFFPVLTPPLREISIVFLANNSPSAQLDLIRQVNSPKLVIWDTMNYWIENYRQDLEKVLPYVDIALLNDEEARRLTGEFNLIKAGKALLKRGIKGVVIKKGEHGSLYISPEDFFLLPAYPVEKVVDPTGAGDTFAGAFTGYLAKEDTLTFSRLKKALGFGTILASFCVEGLGVERLKRLKREEVEARWENFQRMMQF